MLKLAWVNLIFPLAMMAAPASATEKSGCEVQSASWDSAVYRCPLAIEDNVQELLFKATFTGVHDDSRASMTLTLDNAPVACIQGSKTTLADEDGDTLACYLTPSKTNGASNVLVATVKFHHAELDTAGLVSCQSLSPPSSRCAQKSSTPP
jgi:hypothetical protein